MFAAVHIGGKQYFVQPGSVIKVERINDEVGSTVQIGNVLAVCGKAPGESLSGAKVLANVLEHCKTDKVLIFKKKRRHNYRRKKGHRQNITVLRVKEIVA